MSSFPYVQISNIFNTTDYNVLDEGLTIETANKLYLSLGGGLVNGLSTFTNGLDVNVLSASARIETNNNSNTLITNSSVCDTYGLHLHSFLASSNGMYPGSSIAFNNSSSDNVPLSSINLDKIGSGNGNLVFGTRNGATCDERVRITSSGLNVSGSYYAGGTAFINSTCDMSNINTLTFAGTKAIRDVSILDFNLSSLLYKTIMRKSTISGSTGIEFYDTQLTNPKAVVNMRSDNNSEPVFLEMRGSLNDGSIANNGWPAQLRWIGGQGLLAGINLTVSNTSNTGAGVANNVVLSTRNGTIPHVICNDQKNQLHLWPQNLAELNTSYAQNVIIGEELLIRKSLQIGTSQDTARLISALDSNMVGGDARYITLGRDNSSKNQAEISFYYDSGNSNSNRLEFGFYGGAAMYLTAGGRLGLGTSSPVCGLDVAGGENSVLFTNNIAINTYSYAISNNTWSNFGGGPFSANICARFRGSVWIQDRLWATSDRRLKKEITPLDFTLEHYNQLNPVSYKWKNSEQIQLGLIAQEVKNVCNEAVNIVENENMAIEDPINDIEGVQYTVDYNCINMLNVVAIKKLIDKINILEEKLNRNNIQ